MFSPVYASAVPTYSPAQPESPVASRFQVLSAFGNDEIQRLTGNKNVIPKTSCLHNRSSIALWPFHGGFDCFLCEFFTYL